MQIYNFVEGNFYVNYFSTISNKTPRDIEIKNSIQCKKTKANIESEKYRQQDKVESFKNLFTMVSFDGTEILVLAIAAEKNYIEKNILKYCLSSFCFLFFGFLFMDTDPILKSNKKGWFILIPLYQFQLLTNVQIFTNGFRYAINSLVLLIAEYPS